MACDSFGTYAPRAVNSSGNNGVASIGSLITITAQLQSIYPAQSCSDIATLAANYLNALPPETAIVPYNAIIDLTPYTVAGNWSLSGAPVGAGTRNVIFSVRDINNVPTPVGNIAVTYDAAGNVLGVVNNLTIPLLFQTDLTANCTISINGFSSPAFNTNVTVNNALVFIDAPNYVGCIIPACALAPTSGPTVGDTVKCANYTKLFNPLGLSLKDI